MDWKLAIEAERAALESIAALLFSLADLAERAGGRSQAIRGFVLWLLLPAEAVARNLVTGAAMPTSLRRGGNTPADAMRLARNFRDLAAAFRDLSRLALGFADDTDGLSDGFIGPSISDVSRRIGARAATPAEAGSMALRVWRPASYDTS